MLNRAVRSYIVGLGAGAVLLALFLVSYGLAEAQEAGATENVIITEITVGGAGERKGYRQADYGALRDPTHQTGGLIYTITEITALGPEMIIRLGAPVPSRIRLTEVVIEGVAETICVPASADQTTDFVCRSDGDIQWVRGITYDISLAWAIFPVTVPTPPAPGIEVPEGAPPVLDVAPGVRQPSPLLSDLRVVPMGPTANVYFNWLNRAAIEDEGGSVSAMVEYEFDSTSTGIFRSRIPASPNEVTIRGLANNTGYPLTVRIRYIWANNSGGQVTIPPSSTLAGDGFDLAAGASVATLWGERRQTSIPGLAQAGEAAPALPTPQPISVKNDVAGMLVVAGNSPQSAQRNAGWVLEAIATVSALVATAATWFVGRASVIRTGAAGVYILGAMATFVGILVWLALGYALGVNLAWVVLAVAVTLGMSGLLMIFNRGS